jgi:choice-of-anchor B domain-containing protein
MLRSCLTAGALAFACATAPAHAQTPCTDGSAGSYACDGVSLQAIVGFSSLGFPGAVGNDSWGWADPETGREYALMGTSSGTSFVDVTDPAAPEVLGRIPTRTGNSIWRDVKTVGNYAYIVSEAFNHGVQIFDLTRLRDVTGAPIVFTPDAVYTGFGNAHNVVALEERDLILGVGTGTCSGGLHMIDVSSPTDPTFAGCFSADGYTHDAQCVVYTGPDADHQNKSICAASNEDTVTFVDVTDPSAPVELGRATYNNTAYTHQGWFTEDQRYFIANDEGDEQSFSLNTRTLVFDASDLDAPFFTGAYLADVRAIDHNLYVRGNYVFEANYRSGLRVLEIGDLSEAELTEVAFFDTFPGSDATSFDGAWNVYPFLPSGTIIVSDIDRGLFVLRMDEFNPLDAAGTPDDQDARLAVFPNPTVSTAQVQLSLGGAQAATVEVFDVLGRRVTTLHDGIVSGETLTLPIGALPAGAYVVRAQSPSFVLTQRLTVVR